MTVLLFILGWLIIGFISTFLYWKFANYNKLTIGDIFAMFLFSLAGPIMTFIFLEEYFNNIFDSVGGFFSRIAEITVWKKK